MSKLVPFCLALRSPATLGASTTLSEPRVTFEIGFMLALISVALILFVLELFPIEVTAMLMLATLLAFGIVTVEEAILGLSNKAIVTVGAMLVLGHALVKTGILAAAADCLLVPSERMLCWSMSQGPSLSGSTPANSAGYSFLAASTSLIITSRISEVALPEPATMPLTAHTRSE